MKLPSGRAALIIISLFVLIATLIIGILGLFFLGERSPDPRLSSSVQDEYSVPVYLKIVNEAGKNVAYIVPGKVMWDSGHKRLLYNLSNPKESTLAFVESLANNDAEALGLLLSRKTKAYWEGLGYTPGQILDSYKSTFRDMNEPYRYDLEPGEDDMSEGMLAVRLIRDSGSLSLELDLEPDGTWKI